MNETQMIQLRQPFPPELVKWRVGSTTKDNSKGMALAYVDARACMNRLDDIVGAANWQDEYIDSPSGRVFCKVGILIGDEWVWKSDGAGETNVEGEKGAISDAFKRACVKWGLGRYLYDLKSPWVELESRGRSYVIAKSAYGQLNALLGRPTPPPKKTTSPKAEPEKEDNGRYTDSFLQYCVDNIERYENIFAVRNALKKEYLEETGDKKEMMTRFEWLKKHAEKRDMQDADELLAEAQQDDLFDLPDNANNYSE